MNHTTTLEGDKSPILLVSRTLWPPQQTAGIAAVGTSSYAFEVCSVRQPARTSRVCQRSSPRSRIRAVARRTVRALQPTSPAIVLWHGSHWPVSLSRFSNVLPTHSALALSRPARAWERSRKRNRARCSRSSRRRGPEPNRLPRRQGRGCGVDMVLHPRLCRGAGGATVRTQFPIARRACFFDRVRGMSDLRDTTFPRPSRMSMRRPLWRRWRF